MGDGGTSITQSDYLTITGFDLIFYKRNSYFACSIAQSDFHLVYLLTYLTLFGSSYKSTRKYNICLRSRLSTNKNTAVNKHLYLDTRHAPRYFPA